MLLVMVENVNGLIKNLNLLMNQISVLYHGRQRALNSCKKSLKAMQIFSL